MRSEHNFYENKYLKYKKKYLSLKNRIGGASNTPPPPPSAEEIGALLIERALSLKDESNKPDTYRKSKAEEKEDKYDHDNKFLDSKNCISCPAAKLIIHF